MLKKIIVPILLLFLSSCGYEAIYSKKNRIDYDFSVSELTFTGDRDVNNKIKQRINNYTLDRKNKNFTLKISSDAEKVILVKDAAGNSTSFKSTLTVKIEIMMNNKFKNNLQIVESFNYDNNANKSDLKKYEKEIISNLAEIVAEKLLYNLSNTQ